MVKKRIKKTGEIFSIFEAKLLLQNPIEYLLVHPIKTLRIQFGIPIWSLLLLVFC
jgi:hypothetical protein